ncbi:MAG: phospholipase, partial [Opitutaceae bacterium]
LKAWFEDIEPGCQILDWLELGSAGQRALNERFLSYNLPKSHADGGRHYPVVLTGETIDRSLYDFVNSYTGEEGSDGVVRTAAANLDARWLTLEQTDDPVKVRSLPGATTLQLRRNGVRRPPLTPFRIIPEASHSGSKIGIIKSVKPDNAAEKEVVAEVLDALQIADGDDYNAYIDACGEATKRQQQPPGERYFQVVFRVMDDEDQPISDFDLVILAGPDYDPNALPKGFFRDRQRNCKAPNTIVYYMNHDKLSLVVDGLFGFRILARPDNGFAWYAPAEFRSNTVTIDEVIDPNVTTYVDIVLTRHVDRETARFDPESVGYKKFNRARPAGEKAL